jgi:hypothetical protein
MNKYLSRVTSSARGETFNPLLWPFLFATLVYGLGFSVFHLWIGSINYSSLFLAMTSINPAIPVAWGVIATLTIVVGLTFLLFNIPPAGKASGLAGFMVWVFAGFCWALTGGWFLTLALAIPNMWFWIWQYLSLSVFRQEDATDAKTLKAYDDGLYDTARGGRALRESNRGVKRQ